MPGRQVAFEAQFALRQAAVAPHDADEFLAVQRLLGVLRREKAARNDEQVGLASLQAALGVAHLRQEFEAGRAALLVGQRQQVRGEHHLLSLIHISEPTRPY